ncbi:MAG: glutamate-5-semialdehyde dehydrogenase [Pelagibacteraceae bacterium]|nr:glutamate-5-semialdehyde dehydrogenase [Pelagibacteraceae bacterium]|tara:strand:- start:4545 stop:5801 length:1257 start_codon:yes stop_codon:yes gene_type:complete
MTNIREIIYNLGKNAKIASQLIRSVDITKKNIALKNLKKNIELNADKIIEENSKDLDNAVKKNLSPPLINRLKVNKDTINGLIKSINIILELPDPTGKILHEWTQPNGLKFKKISVPLGVIGVIYESRPNVTVDAACISLKSGNALILRGGSDSFYTSKFLVEIISKSFDEAGIPKNIIQMIPTTDRKAVDHLLQMTEYVNVIIPRGGKSLITKIKSTSKIPVIKHLEGICHIYVDHEADLEIAKKVILNSKLRRPEICGATETLLIDEKIKQKAKDLIMPLKELGCEIRGDKFIQSIDKSFINASEADWSTEYLDKILSVKLVNGINEAIHHIQTYSSGHTDCIITENEDSFKTFYNNIDSAIILKNASTQFADGGEFGFGAEIGISTDKLHVRGPVGAQHLTSFKYIIHGSGHERP